jgi:hypothetical protein
VSFVTFLTYGPDSYFNRRPANTNIILESFEKSLVNASELALYIFDIYQNREAL